MKKLVLAVLSLLALVLVTLPITGAAVIMAQAQYCQTTNGLVSPASAKSASASGLSAAQLKIARIIIGVAKNRGLPERYAKVGLMVAKQECNLLNCAYGHLDSLGTFQQRKGWGTAKQRMDPVWASNKFFAVLETVKNRASMSLLDLALAVQRPSRAAYLSPSNNFNSWERMATELLKRYAPATTLASTMVYSDECASSSPNTAGGWHKPLDSVRVGSVWGMRFHPILHYSRLHNGADLSASSGTKIYAVGPGTITNMDRGWNGGAGNYVAINHGGGQVTKYLHMSRFASGLSVGSKVTGGTLIGYVGSTGLSTAPHLHFSWYDKGKGVDPIPKLCQRGLTIAGPKGCSKYSSL